MILRNKASLTAVLVVCMLLLLSCGIGPIFSPAATATPASTDTPIPTSTPLPTATPIPTATLEPTATPQSFAIQDANFQDYKQTCNTDVNINSVNGTSLGISVNTTLTMINGGWAIFCWGAKHTWIGTLTYEGYTFASDAKDPLQFQVDENKGYVYIHGSGTVTQPDKSVVALGSAAGSAANVPAAPASPAGGAVLFHDTFDSNAANWHSGTESDATGDLNRQIVGGKYRFDLTAKQDYFFVLSPVPDFSAKDFIFSIDATVLDTTATAGNLEVGFTFREAEGVNGKRYEFLFYNDGTYVVDLWPSADYTQVKELLNGDMGAAKFEKGVTNNFAIEANGPVFTIFINGNQIGTVTDATVNEAGSMSLWLGLDKSGQTVSMEFDNLTVKAIP
jgi:hypothetical protein